MTSLLMTAQNCHKTSPLFTRFPFRALATPTACLALTMLAPLMARVACAQSAGAMPHYASGKASYHLQFSRPVDFQHLQGLSVRASLNGGPATGFLVDTGSVGVVVSADEVPNIDPKAPAGSIKYSSSGIELDGVWTTVTITFPDSRDAQGHMATAVVPVLAVRERKVSGIGVNAAGKTPSLHPKVHMFGIGFGRGPEAHPERNPFLNLAEMNAGAMHRGYTITRNGFTLGLAGAAVGSGYAFQKLTERAVTPESAAMRPGLKDWETASGSITVGTLKSPMGRVLIDTGLTNMMIGIPDQTALPVGTEIPAGTPITLHLLGGKFDYSFPTGDESSPFNPRKVTSISAPKGVFINTGLRALAGFDYLFDEDGGYLGLRPVKQP